MKTARREMPKTRDQMLTLWCGTLSSPAKDILQVVASESGGVAIEKVAGRLNLQPRGGHWNAGISMLRANDLVRTSPMGFELGPALTELV